MTREEILDYNKRCAEFLGYVNTTPTDKDFNVYKNEKGMIIGNKIYTLLETMSMKFHSDWNWIMEVVEAIESLPFNVKIHSGGCSIEIWEDSIPEEWVNTRFTNIYKYGGRFFQNTRKEAVVEAINQFLIWYNELRCWFYPHKIKKSHPECPEKCIYCNRDHNQLHFHFNKRKLYIK